MNPVHLSPTSGMPIPGMGTVTCAEAVAFGAEVREQFRPRLLSSSHLALHRGYLPAPWDLGWSDQRPAPPCEKPSGWLSQPALHTRVTKSTHRAAGPRLWTTSGRTRCCSMAGAGTARGGTSPSQRGQTSGWKVALPPVPGGHDSRRSSRTDPSLGSSQKPAFVAQAAVQVPCWVAGGPLRIMLQTGQTLGLRRPHSFEGRGALTNDDCLPMDAEDIVQDEETTCHAGGLRSR